MKCPKCGYLGFETTDRCRNCQYDFSLAPFSSEPELTLHGTDRKHELPTDFDLPTIRRQSDTLSATALDLDRLFGDADTKPAPAAEPAAPPPAEPVSERKAAPAVAPPPPPVKEPARLEPEPVEPEPPDPEPLELESLEPLEPLERFEPLEPLERFEPKVTLPFDDAPLVPPPAARTPLAVRRSTPEVPRNRPRTTRPVRAFDFEAQAASKSSEAARDASETVASLMQAPSLAARVGAGLIDVALLLTVYALVLYLTLRVTGLQNTLEDMRVLPLIPFVGFLALIGFGYTAAFTVAGGQTIGKMMLGLRVIGDDGRAIDPAGGMLRALGCMLVPITFGVSYLPALFSSDHRALHDRLAGTRVVQE
jgi:uncharacterized RDD family membrane protein YckC